MSSNPIVSIICLTYKHERYVRECFEGFLMQQTSFPFEVLVYDDASDDATPLIIQEYSNKYPDIFKPTLFKTNQYAQGLGYVGLYDGIRKAKGKYVAYCEGDDFWIDSQKLQKQVDFLEEHPEYEVCAHNTLVISNRYGKSTRTLFSEFNKNLFVSTTKQHYTFNDSLTGNIFHVSSLMYRNIPLSLPPWISKVSAADMVLYMLLALEGDMYVFRDAMSVYRDHSQSLTNTNSEYGSDINFYQLSIRVLRLMNRYWERKYQNFIYPKIAKYYIECAMIYTRRSTRDIHIFNKMIFMAWHYSPWQTIIGMSTIFVKRLLHIQ